MNKHINEHINEFSDRSHNMRSFLYTTGDYPQDTIAAISTPPGRGAVGIIRVSGDAAIDIVRSILKSRSRRALTVSHKMYFGQIVDKRRGETIVLDEVLVSVMFAPHSFTGENMAEINCHGNPLILKNVLNLLISCGARLAEPGEFTKRAYLNNRMDLIQAEAVMGLINAQTDLAARNMAKILSGSLTARIEEAREHLLSLLSHIEVSIDYPEYEEISINEVIHIVSKSFHIIVNLLNTASIGEIIRDGLDVVIMGKPNVGKSTLLNALLRQERAIVSEVAGTTRDAITEAIVYKNILIRLTDTAGLRKTIDRLEQMGVNKSVDYADKSDLIIWVIDGSADIVEEDRAVYDRIAALNKPIIAAINKCDLVDNVDMSDRDIMSMAGISSFVSISAKEQTGTDRLLDAVFEQAVGPSASCIETDEQEIITSIRHRQSLQVASDALSHVMREAENGIPLDILTVDILKAYDELGHMIGKQTDDDVINRIFSEFCVGK